MFDVPLGDVLSVVRDEETQLHGREGTIYSSCPALPHIYNPLAVMPVNATDRVEPKKYTEGELSLRPQARNQNSHTTAEKMSPTASHVFFTTPTLAACSHPKR